VLFLYFHAQVHCEITSYWLKDRDPKLNPPPSTPVCIHIRSVFGSVVAGAFQITFRVKIHANDVFSFFKNYFWHQHIKTIQNVQTILNFNKKKNNFQIFWERGRSRSRVPKHALDPLPNLGFWGLEIVIEIGVLFDRRAVIHLMIY